MFSYKTTHNHRGSDQLRISNQGLSKSLYSKTILKMKSFIVFCFFALVAVAFARPGEHYTDKWDNINLDEILSNKRLLIPHIKCILDEGKCSPEGKELKSHIQEALETDCEKCTETQKSGTRRVIGHIINHEAEYWNQLTAKFDPTKKYVAKYEKELKEVKAYYRPNPYIINHEAEYWNQLTAKFDPTKKYVSKYEKEAQGRVGVTVCLPVLLTSRIAITRLQTGPHGHFRRYQLQLVVGLDRILLLSKQDLHHLQEGISNEIMNFIIFFCLVLAALVSAKPAGTYTDRYDSVNVDEIIMNKRLLEPYVKCLLDQGKCTPEGKELKSHIREALENFCGKCTETQRSGTRKVIAHLINNEPNYWNQLSAKYDGDKKYTKKYESELKKAKA
ncbi:uncharacterized protein [Epargyreus clarus]|uniref:uncharacterized protein n=1 Tax=Epargyreus clarus TaxID=520877 RepID=UPI003C302635